MLEWCSMFSGPMAPTCLHFCFPDYCSFHSSWFQYPDNYTPTTIKRFLIPKSTLCSPPILQAFHCYKFENNSIASSKQHTQSPKTNKLLKKNLIFLPWKISLMYFQILRSTQACFINTCIVNIGIFCVIAPQNNLPQPKSFKYLLSLNTFPLLKCVFWLYNLIIIFSAYVYNNVVELEV